MIRLPGLIDPHVHLREPGATHKEDFASGTAAALAGGFTTVLAMPNTQPPLTDETSLALAEQAAAAKAVCDVGIFLGAGEINADTAAGLAARTCGLKIYLDQTYGPLRLRDLGALRMHLERWPASHPLCVHAEGQSLAAVLYLAELAGRPVHICHVSRQDEILLIRAAKERGQAVTCEVTPQHLFLCEDDIEAIGPGRSEVRPRLATAADRRALWENLEVIDCFATDHAPHTLAEKDGDDPPPGFPGLETALGLLLDAVQDGRLTLDGLVARMHDNPRSIFGIPPQVDTYIEVEEQDWRVSAADLHSRCGWTPFEGRTLHGRVRRVVLRDATVFEDGEVLAAPGSARIVTPSARREVSIQGG